MIDPTTATLVATGIVTAIGLLIKRLSRWKLDIARHHAEGDLISDLIKQRDDARQERDSMEEELMRIGDDADVCLEKVKDLLSKEHQFRIQNALLTNLLERLADSLDLSKRELSAALSQANQPEDD